jgi:hypothetical protein
MLATCVMVKVADDLNVRKGLAAVLLRPELEVGQIFLAESVLGVPNLAGRQL